MKSWKKKIPILRINSTDVILAKIKKRNKMNRFAILILIFTLIVSMLPDYSSAQTYNNATPIASEEIQSYIFEDFSNNSIDISKWNVTATPNIGTVIGSNGQLQMNMKTTATGYAFHLTAASNHVLSGDFDIQVDYSLFNWSAKNGVRSALYLGDVESDSIRIERVSHETGGELYLMQQNLNGAVYPPQGSTSTSDTNGKLRLARTGSTIASYYFNNNQWVKIAEMNSDSDPVPFGLAIWSHDGKYKPQSGEIKVAFDNVILNKGSLTQVQTYDDFNNNDIDSIKWAPHADSNIGFITEANGQLQLGLNSTASGSAFNVTATSNSIVNGDFDIQVDYTLLQQWPAKNGVRAALVIDDLEGNSISVQRVSHEGNGEIYTVDGYQPTAAAYTDDLTGKLRLKRSGNVIKSYYFIDYYWVNLGSYTSTDFADKPIQFKLAMWSHDGLYQPNGNDIIVGFDNLTVTQGEVSLPQYFDDFNGSALDELDISKWNVTTYQNVGTVSVKSGQVQMGLFPTASGDVFNEAISSKYLLYGDFDIQVDYSLPLWSPMNGVRTGLIVSDSEGNRASVQRVSHESAGEIYVMDGYTWDNQPFSAPISVATSDTNGKLRLIRKGNRINSYFSKNNYWVYIGSYSTTVIGNKPVGISLEMWSHDGFYRPQGNEIQVAFDNLIINQGNIFPPPVTGKVSNITFTEFDLSFDYAIPSLNRSDISLSNGATVTNLTATNDSGLNYHVTMELANNQTPFPLSITKPEYSFKEFVIGNPNSLFRIGKGTVDSPYWVENKYDLHYVRECLTCSYILMRNLDLSGWPWDPIGGYKGLMSESDSPDPIFEGDFDGNGNTISNLKVEYLDSTNGENWRRGETGLFGHTFSAKIKDLTLINPNIYSAFPYVGSLVGSAEYSTLTNIKIINPKVSGRYPVGLIVGNMEYSKASMFSVENYTGSTLPMVGRDIDYSRTWTVDKVQKLAGVSGNKINYALTVNPPLPGLAASDFLMNNGATVDQVWTPDNGGTYYVTSNLSNLYVRKYDVTVTWQRYDGPTQSTFHVKVPSLNSVEISKKEATVGSLIEIAADFTNLGVNKATLHYLPPQGKSQKEVPLEYNSATGKFEGYFEVGQYDASGTWKFGYLRIEDQHYDAFFYYNSDYYKVDPIIGDTHEYLDLSKYNVEVTGTTPDLDPQYLMTWLSHYR